MAVAMLVVVLITTRKENGSEQLGNCLVHTQTRDFQYCTLWKKKKQLLCIFRPVARGGSLGSDEPPFQIVKNVIINKVMFTRID